MWSPKNRSKNSYNKFFIVKKTVGKTYMACSGLKDCDSSLSPKILLVEKTLRALTLAIKMMSYSEEITWGLGNKLILKIGIHVGRVMAGVIGHHKPQFSLIGDTVNTTSRVCSTGLEGKITLSESAYLNLKNINNHIFIKRNVEVFKNFILSVKVFYIRQKEKEILRLIIYNLNQCLQ